VIQISPQIQVDNSFSAAKVPERASQKQNKLGVFAKLLEGLKVRAKSGGVSAALIRRDAPDASGEAEKENPVKAGKNLKSENRKKSPPLGEAEFFGVSFLPREPDPGRTNAPPSGEFSPEAPGEKESVPLEGSRPREAPEPYPQKAMFREAPRNPLPKVEAPGAEKNFPDTGVPEAMKAAGDELFRSLELEEEKAGGERDLQENNGFLKEAPVDIPVFAPPAGGIGEGLILPEEKPGRFEKEGSESSPLQEAKSGKRSLTSKSRDRFNIEVRDLRTGAVQALETSGLKPAGEAGPMFREAAFTVELKDGESSRPQGGPAGENPGGRAFEDIFARELHENLNHDIVRHASVLVKDGGEGTIRLFLKPQTLGNVKIRLEMAENKIMGHIIVESNEALRAFGRELYSLEQSFKDSGFDGAAFDMSLAQDGGQNGADRQRKGEDAFFLETLAASRYDASAEKIGPAEAMPGTEWEGPFPAGHVPINMLV
jgi:hypothetical protein